MELDTSMTGLTQPVGLGAVLDAALAPQLESAPPSIISELLVDGSRYFVILHIDTHEHERRCRRGLSHASARLLHTLWGLPAHIGFPIRALDSVDQATVVEEGEGWVKKVGSSITRLYQPIGRVDMVAVVDREIDKAVTRAASHPATTKRLAIWSSSSKQRDRGISDALDCAAQLGLGVVNLRLPSPQLLVPPAPALIGRPAVYRWWQAEIAYRNWLMRTAPTGRAENGAVPPW
jgi:hypothetical protein